jgi:hypothetical protein
LPDSASPVSFASASTVRTKERYKELSEHAEVEDDPKKLRKIANEINRILKAEINRLKNGPNGPKP